MMRSRETIYARRQWDAISKDHCARMPVWMGLPGIGIVAWHSLAAPLAGIAAPLPDFACPVAACRLGPRGQARTLRAVPSRRSSRPCPANCGRRAARLTLRGTCQGRWQTAPGGRWSSRGCAARPAQRPPVTMTGTWHTLPSMRHRPIRANLGNCGVHRTWSICSQSSAVRLADEMTSRRNVGVRSSISLACMMPVCCIGAATTRNVRPPQLTVYAPGCAAVQYKTEGSASD